VLHLHRGQLLRRHLEHDLVDDLHERRGGEAGGAERAIGSEQRTPRSERFGPSHS
jgi:hypothetical protein